MAGVSETFLAIPEDSRKTKPHTKDRTSRPEAAAPYFMKRSYVLASLVAPRGGIS